MIVWIASYPRSGNTYFRMLLHHALGFKTFSVHDDPDLEGIGAAETVGHERLPKPIVELAEDDEVHFVKTHRLPRDGYPAVYLVRDGRDAIVSYARYRCQFENSGSRLGKVRDLLQVRRFSTLLRELVEGREAFDAGWSAHVLQWVQGRIGPKTVVIKYEDLVADPLGHVRVALEEHGISSEAMRDTRIDFEELHRKWPQFFRKGKTGAWREEMPAHLHEKFWRYHHEAMDLFGYARDGVAGGVRPSAAAPGRR